jgi:hypothetical protein
MAGVYTVTIQGLNTGTLDLTTNGWGHVVGLDGERRRVHSEQGMGAVAWKPGKDNQPLTWYRRRFDPPSGTDPVVIDLTPMGKGFLFVNGEGLGRYWVSYHHALGKPSQYLYHVPRSLLRPKGNTLMFFEEEGGKPDAIMILTVKRDNICTFMTEKNPAHVRWSWESKDSQPKAVAGAGAGEGSPPWCPASIFFIFSARVGVSCGGSVSLYGKAESVSGRLLLALRAAGLGGAHVAPMEWGPQGGR